MKFFLNKITLGIFIFITVSLSVLIVTNIIIRQNANFIFDKNEKNIIIGHSIPQCAYNDSLIDNLINISESGESYFYTYIKLNEIINQNKKIRTIFIEYTNNNIPEKTNHLIWDKYYISKSYNLNYPFMKFEDNLLIVQKSWKDIISLTINALGSNILRTLTSDYFFISKIGGYFYLTKSKIDVLLKEKKLKPKKNSINKYGIEDISVYNLNYLAKCINLCKKNKIKIYLIRSPLHQESLSRSNEELYQKIRKEKFNDIEFLDFSNVPLKNHEFADFEHLNYKGAEKYSIWFNDIIELGLLNKTNKQNFINSKIGLYK